MLVNYFSCIVDAVSRIGSNMFSQLTIHVTKSSTVGVFIFLNLCLCSHSVYAEQSQSEQDLLKPMLSMEVGRVVDGDSLYLAGQPRQIRLWGVDAPERNPIRCGTKSVAIRARLSNGVLLFSRGFYDYPD